MLGNGELLAAAENARFDVFVTTDRNLRYQQNLSSRKISVIVLSTTSWLRIKPFSNVVLSAINEAKPNSFVEIEIPNTAK